MLKKILIGVAVFAVLAYGVLWFLNKRQRTLSPPGKAEITSGDLTVTVNYSRPSVRDRVMFGTEAEGAKQPYGKYWRLGANEATEITFSRDVNFNGTAVKAGTYSIYTIPGPDSFEVVLNSETDKWGYSEADHDLDVMKTTVPVEKGGFMEQHTISFESLDNGVNMVVEFEKVKLRIPITV